ncbi:MAG TPA: MerR family transcriptional regulator [Pseudonocardiaceae bacterium]
MSSSPIQDLDPDLPRWTVRQAAELLRMPVATLRSWQHRYGIGPSGRRAGQHRRYSANDLELIRRIRHLTANGVPIAVAVSAATTADAGPPVEPGETPADPTDPAGRLAAAARRMDAGPAAQLLGRHLARHGVTTTWNQVCLPALNEVAPPDADLDRSCIAPEHLLSELILSALNGVGRGATVTAPSVLLACADGERHTLGIAALRAGLVERGMTPRMLGAAVPADALRDAITRAGQSGHPVRAVVVWSQVAATADPAAITTVTALDDRILAITGGPGWRDPAAVHPASLTDAIALLRSHLGQE